MKVAGSASGYQKKTRHETIWKWNFEVKPRLKKDGAAPLETEQEVVHV